MRVIGKPVASEEDLKLVKSVDGWMDGWMEHGELCDNDFQWKPTLKQQQTPRQQNLLQHETQ
jgi:hypothetical protein